VAGSYEDPWPVFVPLVRVEDFGKDMVIPVPVPPLVEWDQVPVPSLEPDTAAELDFLEDFVGSIRKVPEARVSPPSHLRG
jgi:hypothetical protein